LNEEYSKAVTMWEAAVDTNRKSINWVCNLKGGNNDAGKDVAANARSLLSNDCIVRILMNDMRRLLKS